MDYTLHQKYYIITNEIYPWLFLHNRVAYLIKM